MLELFSESFRIPNLPATILLLIVLLYWIINLLGVFDIDMFHGDVGDIDHDVHAESHGGLNVFNFGDLPITIVISFFALFLWMGTILSNFYFHNSSLLIGLAILIPNMIVAFILTKVVAMPLAKAYSKLNAPEEDAETDFSGSVCIINVEANHQSIGQGEINKNGDSFLVNLKTSEGKVIKKGQTALLIEYYPDKGYYLGEHYESA